jgi:L,D-transpeptidase YcbB
MFKRHLLLLSVLLLSICSCQNQLSEGGDVTDFFKPAVVDLAAVNSSLGKIDNNTFNWSAVLGNDSSLNDTFFELAYGTGRKESKWFNKLGLNANAQELILQLTESDTEGLRPSDYNTAKIDSLSKLLMADKLDARETLDLEILLTYAYVSFGKDLLLGRLVPLDLDENWQNKNDTTWNIDSFVIKLNTTKMVDILNAQRPQHPWYAKFKNASVRLKNLANVNLDFSALKEELVYGDSALVIPELRKTLNKLVNKPTDITTSKWGVDLEQAIELYQRANELEVTGKIDKDTRASLSEKSGKKQMQLAMNMERMRWLVKDFNKEYIWVNIPQMQVEYFEEDSVTFKMNAVVGRVGRKTPTLDSKMSNIVFNPPWYVPPTILKQEVVPGIARRGGSYLRRRGLVARDRRGRIVDASRINSSNYKRYSISQNPGRNSALGSVKFNFPNKESIFLHDTNHRGDFNKKYRAFSSGCIRVHHPKDFAAFLLRDSAYSIAKVDTVIAKKATKSVKIDRDIGVHIVYLTNAVDSLGNVLMVKDIYKWDDKFKAYF